MVSQALVGLAVSLVWVVTGVGWCWCGQVCPLLPPQPHTGTLLSFTLLYYCTLLFSVPFGFQFTSACCFLILIEYAAPNQLFALLYSTLLYYCTSLSV
jgi:hypothetical protein